MDTDLTDFSFLRSNKRIWGRFVGYTEAIIVEQSGWTVSLQQGQYALSQARNPGGEAAMSIALC